MFALFFFSSRRRHTRYWRDWSSDVCSSDLAERAREGGLRPAGVGARRERPVTPRGLEGWGRRPGDHSHHEGRGPGRDQVGEVVEPGRGPAELLVGTLPVADHRVQGVYGPVDRKSVV